jgi:hypothetical protein
MYNVHVAVHVKRSESVKDVTVRYERVKLHYTSQYRQTNIINVLKQLVKEQRCVQTEQSH